MIAVRVIVDGGEMIAVMLVVAGLVFAAYIAGRTGR